MVSLLAILFTGKISAQTYSNLTITGTPVCAGGSITINYTRGAGLGATNADVIQLSDTAGLFNVAGAVTLPGPGVSNAAGPVSFAATIPAAAIASDKYRIRVKSSVPANDSATSAQFTVYPAAAVSGLAFPPETPATRCQGDIPGTFTATASNNFGPITYSIVSQTPGSPMVTITDAGLATFPDEFAGTVTIRATAQGCGGPITATHVVTVVGKPAFATASSTRCLGAAPQTYTASNYNGSPITYSILSPTLAGLSVNASGQVTFPANFSGTVVLAAAAGTCSQPGSLGQHTINVTGKPAFQAGDTSFVCAGIDYLDLPVDSVDGLPLTYTIISQTPTLLPATINNSGRLDFAPLYLGGVVRVTAYASTCSTAVDTHTVVVTGIPVFQAGASSTRCQAAGTEFYPPTGPGLLPYTYLILSQTSIRPSDPVTLGPNGAVNFPATFAGKVTLATFGGACASVLGTHEITVVGIPLFDSGAATVRCQGAATVTYKAVTNLGVPVTYTLQQSPATPVLTINNQGQVTYPADFAGTAIIKAYAGNCDDAANISTHTAVTTANPVFTAGASSTRCQGTAPVTYTATSVNSSVITYAIQSPAVPGLSINNSGEVTYPGSFAGDVVVSAYAGACGLSAANRITHTATTTANPAFTAGASSGRCQAATTETYTAISANSSAITYTIETPSSGLSINTSGQIAYPAGFAGDVLISAYAGTCSLLTANRAYHAVTVTGTPAFLAGTSGQRCQDTGSEIYTATNINNSVIRYAIQNATPATPGPTIDSVTGRITYPDNFSGSLQVRAWPVGCTGNTAIHNVIVSPAPVITSTTAASVCSGAPLSIPLTATTSGSKTYIWTIDTTGSGVSGAFPQGTAVSGPLSQTLINPSNAAPAVIRYFVTAFSQAGCISLDTRTVAVTVNPTPALISAFDSLCSDAAPAFTLNSTTGANSSYTWQRLPQASYPAINGTNNLIAGHTLVNGTNTTPDTARYAVTLTSTFTTCTGRDTVRIKVNPKPTVLPTSLTSICSGTATAVQLAASIPGSTFNWAFINNPAISIVSNGIPTSLNDSIRQVLSVVGPGTDTARYRIVATSRGCTGPADTAKVAVQPRPVITVSAASNPYACSESKLNILLTQNLGLSNDHFYWSATPTPGIQVFPPVSFSNIISDSVTSGNLSNTATINYIINDSSSSGCLADPVSINVAVYPKPRMNNLAQNTAVCSDAPLVIPVTANTGAGALFAWTTSDITGTTDGNTSNPTAANLTSISQTLHNTSNFTASSVRYVITPTATFNIPGPGANTLACIGHADSINVTVHPRPIMTSDTARSICSDATLTYQVTSSTGTGSTYTWERTGGDLPTTGNNSPVSVLNSIQDLLSTSPSLVAKRVRYEFVLTSNQGCPSLPNQVLNVTVNPTPTTPGISIFPNNGDICQGVQALNFRAGRLPDATEYFKWTSTNGGVYQKPDSSHSEGALIGFPVGGVTETVRVMSTVRGYNCPSDPSDRQVNVNPTTSSSNPRVVKLDNAFICLSINEVTHYQWGKDSKTDLDSSILNGETSQTYLFPSTGLNDTADFNYWVMATFSDGCTRKAYYNQPAKLGLTGNGAAAALQLKVYPNPVHARLTIEVPGSGDGVEYEICDLAGKRLMTAPATGQKTALDISQLSPGYYIIRGTLNGQPLANSRFIKQ